MHADTLVQRNTASDNDPTSKELYAESLSAASSYASSREC